MKKIVYSLPFIIAAVVVFLTGAFSAEANPSFIGLPATTATATGTVSYMSAGRATTTLTYDTAGIFGDNQTNVGNPYATDKAVLLVQNVASSTSSILAINVEYSNDKIDWYQDPGTLTEGFATTSKPFDISQVNQYILRYASSTAGLGTPTASQSTTTRAIQINAPLRYVRAVFSVPVGATPGAVYAEIVPKKEKY